MAQQVIGIGAAPNDGTGDAARTAFTKVNENFTEVYAQAAAAVTAHEAAGNPHPGYLTPAEGDVAYQPLAAVLTNTTASFLTADETKLDGIAAGATVGATWGSNVTNQPSVVAQAEAEAGSATTERIWTAQRVAQAIAALGGGGSPIGYVLYVQALTSSPADGATVFFGCRPVVPSTTAAQNKVFIPKTGSIKRVDLYTRAGTAGTGEAWSAYVRLNNTTDTLIATLSVTTNERVFSNGGLDIAVTAGDYIEIKMVNPTWATNPLTFVPGGYVYIE